MALNLEKGLQTGSGSSYYGSWQNQPKDVKTVPKTLFDLFSKILYDPKKDLPDPDIYYLVADYIAELKSIPVKDV